MSDLQPLLYEPVVQVRPKKLIAYSRYVGPPGNRVASELRNLNMLVQRAKAYGGSLSPGARKRMIKAISLLCAMTEKRFIFNPVTNRSQEHHLSFLTLTISDVARNYTSREVYKSCLRPLLQWLVKTHNVRLYVWVAELQKRGQIHYHIVFPNFVNYQEIRNKWNYLQLKAGYLEGFQAKHGHIDPNSTDIHSMRKIRNAASYLVKYMSKGPRKPKKGEEAAASDTPVMDGKIWDCCLVLKSAKYFETLQYTSLNDMVMAAVRKGKAVIEQLERCAIVKLVNCSVEDILPLSDLMDYKQYLRALVSQAYASPAEVPI